MDATTVKTEIKTWERDFRAQNGRNATVEDIKAHPHIAEKYKLYKKLTKEAEATKGNAKTQVPEPPRTPPPRAKPRHPDHASSNAAILPKSRPIASTADDATVTQNPFSPVKRKQAVSNSITSTSTSANPFLTPLKAKRTRTLSPNPFPPAPAPAPALAPGAHLNAAAAVIKARKRRGEPVSPSPQPRDKRRRLDAFNHRESPSRSVSPTQAPIEEGDSFVDDSPVKPPVGGKAFKPLFEEAKPMRLSQPGPSKANAAMRGRAFTRARTVPGALFGAVKKEGKDVQREMIERNVFGESAMEVDGATRTNGKEKRKEKALPVDGTQKAKKKRVLPGPKGLIPGRDDLFEAPPPATAVSSSSSSASGRDTKTSRKRTLSKVVEDEPKEERPTLGGWDLLPPSPPPQQDGGGRYNAKGKGKAKAAPRKSKKAKLSPVESDEDTEDDGSSSESADVKMVAWRGCRRSPTPADGDDLALTLDPELQFNLRGRPIDARTQSASTRLEKFEVDLPEEMRRVLALSPHDREREKEEEDLVKGLITGRRAGGGEVWGPGEVGGESEEGDEGAVRRFGEDDWEGEGVPWEVGEL